MSGPGFDDVERHELCDLLERLGPDAPTVLAPWTTRDIAVHLYLREHDPIAGPGLAMSGPWAAVATRRHRRALRRDYARTIDAVRSGPRGVFRLSWLKQVPNLNEMFVHHEDVRRANGGAPRNLDPAMDQALWDNVKVGAWFLCRRLRGCGLILHNASTGACVRARKGPDPVRATGQPGEILLFVFGRQGVADVELDGPSGSLALVRRAHFGM